MTTHNITTKPNKYEGSYNTWVDHLWIEDDTNNPYGIGLGGVVLTAEQPPARRESNGGLIPGPWAESYGLASVISSGPSEHPSVGKIVASINDRFTFDSIPGTYRLEPTRRNQAPQLVLAND